MTAASRRRELLDRVAKRERYLAHCRQQLVQVTDRGMSWTVIQGAKDGVRLAQANLDHDSRLLLELQDR